MQTITLHSCGSKTYEVENIKRSIVKKDLLTIVKK